MSYDCIRYEDLVEGQDILAFGYHVTRWVWHVMGTPAYGFVPSKADDEIERLKARVAELETKQRWIAIGERKPDCDEFLALLPNKSIEKFTEFYGRWKGEYAVLYDVNDFTHWMPLPESEEEE